MFFMAIVLLLLLPIKALGDYQPENQYYSFSPQVGSGQGRSYAITGNGRITGVRVWEARNNYIYGLQIRYGYTWSNVTGYTYGEVQEILLFEDEAIVQICGKYSHYVQSLVFTTNLGRSLYAGQPQGHTFNMFPTNEKAELRFISGRVHGAITAIGAHWAVVSDLHGTTRKLV
ncbi:zymogen granule membrane protein 16-like [Phyllopteryx taeniolatus]|uniref:zymogen granule membrane protein 16-like n=1 Tax=Phyllopteryx taeniolatus TaxID=161469 RepID=UPI002AD1D5FE|nr:zymogen granule membrane protein 16-like [Phyllopteryx taeniolatus]XP_061616827.1 zymogen granule membrane protein 16-like [Phyllopteryx taeniolatus]